MNFCDTWMTRSGFENARKFAKNLPLADDIGYVYVLSLSTNVRKLGCTANLAQRLGTHHSEMSRYGVKIEHCSVTRPHFNFRSVEYCVLRLLHAPDAREMLPNAYEDVCNAVSSQQLDITAPHDYVRRHQSAHAYVSRLIRNIGERLGLPSQPQINRTVNSVLDSHIALGRMTGLSEADSMLNALAVIEAKTGLRLQHMRDALMEVA